MREKKVTVFIWILTTLIVITSFISVFEGVVSCSKVLDYLEFNRNVKFEVINGESKEILYVKYRKWGVAGNHEEIVISPYRDSLANPETDYIISDGNKLYLDNSHKKVIIIIPKEYIPEPKTKYINFEIKQDPAIDSKIRKDQNSRLIIIDLFDYQNSVLIIKNE